MITDTTNALAVGFLFLLHSAWILPRPSVSLLGFFVYFLLLKHVYTAADTAVTGCVHDEHTDSAF